MDSDFFALVVYINVFIFTTTQLELFPWAALDSSESSFGGAVNKVFFFFFFSE